MKAIYKNIITVLKRLFLGVVIIIFTFVSFSAATMTVGMIICTGSWNIFSEENWHDFSTDGHGDKLSVGGMLGKAWGSL